MNASLLPVSVPTRHGIVRRTIGRVAPVLLLAGLAVWWIGRGGGRGTGQARGFSEAIPLDRGMHTPEHAALIAQLESAAQSTWGEQALLACLRRLRDGGPTEAEDVEVRDAWASPTDFSVVYKSPSGPQVGVHVTAESTAGNPPFYFQDVYTEDLDSGPTAAEAGITFADFAIAEPLGGIVEGLVYDADGLGWWGEEPLPATRLRQ